MAFTFAHCAGMAPRLGRLLLLPLELPLELVEEDGERAMSSRNE
jgi:hypothetical protein